MSVHTPLEPFAIAAFVERYGVQMQHCTAVTDGMENSNWFITGVDGQRWVLTVFETQSMAETQQRVALMAELDAQGVPVALPCTTDAGDRLGTLAGKPAQLAPCLVGEHPHTPTMAQARSMGVALAHLHRALDACTPDRPLAQDAAWWMDHRQRLQRTLPRDDQGLLERLLGIFFDTKNLHVPTGLVHGDLFRDNTLMQGDRVTGFLDFGAWGRAARLLDVAIVVNDFCSRWPQLQLDVDKTRAFLAAYQTSHPFTTVEKQAFSRHLALAAGRFWLSRLQAQAHSQTHPMQSDARVLIKDPEQMRAMLVDRLRHLDDLVGLC